MRKVIGTITPAEPDAADSLSANYRRVRFEVAVAELPGVLRELIAELRLARERRTNDPTGRPTPSSRAP